MKRPETKEQLTLTVGEIHLESQCHKLRQMGNRGNRIGENGGTSVNGGDRNLVATSRETGDDNQKEDMRISEKPD